MYDDPCTDKPCIRCVYREYDTFHDELWCTHKPPPDYLPNRLIVNREGTCEYWEKYKE